VTSTIQNTQETMASSQILRATNSFSTKESSQKQPETKNVHRNMEKEPLSKEISIFFTSKVLRV